MNKNAIAEEQIHIFSMICDKITILRQLHKLKRLFRHADSSYWVCLRQVNVTIVDIFMLTLFMLLHTDVFWQIKILI